MKKHILILFASCFSLMSSAQLIPTRGLYVDGFINIIGNTASEDSLLTFAQNNSFNYLALYDLWQVHTTYGLTSVTTSSVLANFIHKAKQNYNILQVGAVGENFYFFNNVINIYNQQHPNAFDKFDVYNIEFEFWNTTTVSTGNYYCTTYLQPSGYSCDTAGAFAYYKVLTHQVDSLANSTGVLSEAYVGWFNQGQAITLSNTVDRLLLHDYISNYSSLYSYIKQRLQYIAARNISTTVIPILSSEPAFMGPWLTTHTTWQPYNDLNVYLAAETGTWKQYIILGGYQWFDYGNMPGNLYVTGIEKDSQQGDFNIYPNPTKEELTIQWNEVSDAIISVTDINGREVMKANTFHTSSATIAMSDLRDGVYFCAVTIRNNRVVKKIVILN